MDSLWTAGCRKQAVETRKAVVLPTEVVPGRRPQLYRVKNSKENWRSIQSEDETLAKTDGTNKWSKSKETPLEDVLIYTTAIPLA